MGIAEVDDVSRVRTDAPGRGNRSRRFDLFEARWRVDEPGVILKQALHMRRSGEPESYDRPDGQRTV